MTVLSTYSKNSETDERRNIDYVPLKEKRVRRRAIITGRVEMSTSRRENIKITCL
jgi:hypothetical protein